MNDDSSDYRKNERFLFQMMDAIPKTIGFEPTDLRVIRMLPRHNQFELTATDDAMRMLGIEPPLKANTLDLIEDAIKRMRQGERLECDDAFPAARLGVLWGWHLVTYLGWQWKAVAQDWWETLGVCDPQLQYVILPVQYMRQIGEDPAPVTRWPRDYVQMIRAGELPAPTPGKLLLLGP